MNTSFFLFSFSSFFQKLDVMNYDGRYEKRLIDDLDLYEGRAPQHPLCCHISGIKDEVD